MDSDVGPVQTPPSVQAGDILGTSPSSPIARRPLKAAVAAAAAISTPLSTASSTQGTCTSMVQWNDWRLTT